MATIKIRGRVDPITLDDERALKIKQRKFGVEGRIVKAEPNELVDLGEWSGEYGRIVEIELSTAKSKSDKFDEELKKERLDREAWMARSAKVKAQTVGWFKVLYAGRSGDWKAKPSPELLEKVIAFQEKWYEQNPLKMPMRISSRDYGDLLPKGNSVKLADKMRVSHSGIDYPS